MHKNPDRQREWASCIDDIKIGVRTKIIPFYIFGWVRFFFLLLCLLPNYSIFRIARDFNTISNLHKLFIKPKIFSFWFHIPFWVLCVCLPLFFPFRNFMFQVKMIHLCCWCYCVGFTLLKLSARMLKIPQTNVVKNQINQKYVWALQIKPHILHMWIKAMHCHSFIYKLKINFMVNMVKNIVGKNAITNGINSNGRSKQDIIVESKTRSKNGSVEYIRDYPIR